MRAAVSGSTWASACDQDRAVRAHGEAGAQLLLRVRGADADDDDLAGAAFLLDAQRLFERDLVERVDAHLDAVGHDTRAVRLDADADVVVDDPFQAHQNLAHTRLRKGHPKNGVPPDGGAPR